MKNRRVAKNVIITGSTSGIGLGIARVFAQAGYHLILNGLEKEGPEIASKLAQEFGIKALYHPANMLKPEEIREMVAFCEKELGPCSVLVNNAGIQFVSPVDEFPDEKWEAILGINLSSSFYTSKAVWKTMKAQQWGRIINIASAHGLVASEFKSAYVAAKHGVVGLTKVMALEGAPFGITCNAICPGYVKTPLVEKQIAEQAKAHQLSEKEVIEKVMLAKHAIKDFVTVEQLGKLALFLASDDARLITGTAMPVDGGWNAQ
jgi:3-hydroxybutyrate dehydrogenase